MRKDINFILLMLVSTACFCQSTNVGINTITSDRAKIEVNGISGSGATSGAFGTDGSGISIQRNWPTIGFNQYRDDVTPGSQGKYITTGYAALQYFDIVNGQMVFDMFPSGAANASTPAAARALTLAANGNVGIRGGVGNTTLLVQRGDGFDGTAVFAGSQHWSHINYSSGEQTYIRGGADGSHVYINKIPSGNVFVGNGNTRLVVNNPPYSPLYTIDMLQPSGQNFLSIYDEYGYSWHQRLSHTNISGQGDGYILDFYYGTQAKGRFLYYNGVYTVYSDARLKKNIEELPLVMNKIKSLRPVSYEMINDNPGNRRTYGFIAQEVKSLFPNLVRVINAKTEISKNGIPDLHTLNYSGITVLAIKALQEQNQQIDQLENETAELMKKLATLEERSAAK